MHIELKDEREADDDWIEASDGCEYLIVRRLEVDDLHVVTDRLERRRQLAEPEVPLALESEEHHVSARSRFARRTWTNATQRHSESFAMGRPLFFATYP